ncbi:MAG: hypothetical protein Q9203_007426, partial [Teloschistes exilis]
MATEPGRYFCRDCNADVGLARNEWHKVDRGHWVYNASFSYHGVEMLPHQEQGDREWEELKFCTAHPLVCKACRRKLGFKITNTNRRKPQYMNKSFFSPLRLQLYSMADGKTVDLHFHVKDQPDSDNLDTGFSFATAPQTLPPPASSMSASSAPTGRNGTQVPASATSGIHSGGPANLSNANTAVILNQQRTDIDRIGANVDKLLEEMKTVKASVDYIKFQQQTFFDNDTAMSQTDHADDLGALTKDIARVSDKVKEFDGLKDELNTIKDRVQRLEDTIQSNQLQTNNTRSNQGLDSSNGLREIPSSTRSPTGQSLPHSDLDLPVNLSQEDGAGDSLVDSLRRSQDQHVLSTRMSLDEPIPRKNYGISGPLITSAQKVAALKRRRQSSSSSSSSFGTPPPIKHSKAPKTKGKPDWSTKPNSGFGNKGKLISLNDHTKIATSDPEDSDYGPTSQSQNPELIGATEVPSRCRSKPLMRLPTPEWEKSDWEGPSYSNTRAKHMARRGMNGRASLPNTGATLRRNSGYESYASMDDNRSATIGSFATGQRKGSSSFEVPKARDSQGRLLRPNGKVDGRSLRYQKEREAIAKLKAGPGLVSKGHHQRAREAREKLEALERQKKEGNRGQQTETAVTQKNVVDPTALAAPGYDNTKQGAFDGAADQEDGTIAGQERDHEATMKM